ncbi:FAD-dependent oxidoreductase [Neolewinella agarilytica]|uniref:FAD dependent oxidoreductase n=1 Tax=Neolewinella agarilytica TaxID=478744 RepID=A0A1H9EEA4_9BACT|nr:FAD-dependent oxidoreductase [Neolewinella agarilytica]SEQ23892.1 FAD dependent oxidoreductase [Neolewinella agarilytica]
MKRRDFFKKSAKQALTVSLVPLSGMAAAGEDGPRDKGGVIQELPNGEKSGVIHREKTLNYDVAVIGGGMAGMCAAVSAARNGAKTVLVQDRPVLGGNASSEIRVHVNGVTHLKGGKPERETGVIEELLLHNRFHNPQESYPVWDHVLYGFITAEDNLDLIMNTQATKAEMDNGRIKAAKCWQQTTETTITINADIFIDCSGDGLLAATAGAVYRTGREGKAEFGEKYAPDEPDGWQMGASLMLEAKDMGRPMPFEAPHFTIPFDPEIAHKGRKFNNYQNGIWWIEVGSDDDIIGEFEENRHKLMGYAYGLWDYIKNSGKFPESANEALDWVCSLPGRRESRRFMGDYILKEPDMLGYKQFEDAVAYGGWSLDEHNPGGIEDLKAPPSFFHEHFHRVYQIPYRSLYSKNVPNLLFAGRNISQSHIALSSSRVMATCATMGQAVGTAAAICIAESCGPREVYKKHLNQLQEQLLRDDAFIPDRPARDEKDLARTADLIIGSSTSSGDAALLTDGWSRDFLDVVHHWESEGLPANAQLEWREPVLLRKIEIKCDTNVRRNILMRKDSKVSKTFTNTVPEELLKTISVEGRVKGQWVSLGKLDKNKRRLIKFTFPPQRFTAIRINLEETYGAANAKLFEVRCYA